LRGWQEKLPAIGEVRGLGLMIGVELVKDRATKAPDAALAQAVKVYCREHGVLVGVGGSEGNVVRVQPPLVIGEDDLAHALDIIAAGIGASTHVTAGA
jgi:4-aminobutyrate aminotransferase / (S)-3-amino-2-methylpropionate transaminase / 5-aminovalerate transaminase